MLLPIFTNPDPILRKKALEIKPADLLTDEMQSFCFNMSETMAERDGVGLAAPQVGKSIRLIVINTKDGPLCMINPEITKTSWAKEWDTEGCLSLPGIYGDVKRHKKITCDYLDRTGKKQRLEANGLMARVIQHETDHLDGILFIDKAKRIEEHEVL
jgi:peptide deformylase